MKAYLITHIVMYALASVSKHEALEGLERPVAFVANVSLLVWTIYLLCQI